MASSISGRGLHHVFKIGNRAATMDFYRNILGMKVSTEGGLIANCNQSESESNLISDAIDGDERTLNIFKWLLMSIAGSYLIVKGNADAFNRGTSHY